MRIRPAIKRRFLMTLRNRIRFVTQNTRHPNWEARHQLAAGNDARHLIQAIRGVSLPLFWARNPRETNFGDELTSLMIPFITGQETHWSPLDRRCLVGAGSVLSWLEMETSNQPRVIWGSGLMHEDSTVKLTSDFVVSVRGSLSRDRLRGPKANDLITLGDPGLLADTAFPQEQMSNPQEILLIPHLVDRQSKGVSQIISAIPNVTVLDLASDPVAICARIAQAKLVISSALHPLIVADSYGVPNIWLTLSDNVLGGNFKFHDYYSVFGLKPLPLSAEELLQSFDSKQALAISEYERPGLQKIKLEIREALDQALELIASS
jgi:pyruvyltransferase